MTPPNDDTRFAPAERLEREWQRQESGQDAGYRAVLQALKAPPPGALVDLPADFAARIARQAVQPPSPWFEALLPLVAVALFGLAFVFIQRISPAAIAPWAWPHRGLADAALWSLLALGAVAWPLLTLRFWKEPHR